MIIRLKGIKKVKRGDYVHYYHRKTMQVKGANARIYGEYGSPEFIENYNRLESATLYHSKEVPGTWGHLVEHYKRSPEFDRLKPRTKKSYNIVFNYLRPIRSVMLDQMTPASILRVRDKAFKAHKITFANNALAVMKLVFSWGVQRDLLPTNPATNVRKIRKPKGNRKQNRPWTEEEFNTVMNEAPAHLKLAVGLAGYIGIRREDIIKAAWSSYNGSEINIVQGKSDQPIWVPVHRDFKPFLDGAIKTSTQIVTGSRGNALTPDGLSTNWQAFRAKMLKDGKIGTGLTLHGLRSTVLTRLAEADCTLEQIKAVSGHLSDTAIKTYLEQVNKKKNASAAILKWEQESNRNGKL